MNKKLFLLSLFALLVWNSVQARENVPTKTIDSLQIVLKTAKQDTLRVNALIAIAGEFAVSNPDTVNVLYEMGLAIIENNLSTATGISRNVFIGYKALIFGNIGDGYETQGNLSKALEYHYKSLKLQEEIQDEQGIATSLNSIGMIYSNQGDAPKALEYCQKSLKIVERLNDKLAIANALNNIGSIYTNSLQTSEALEYYQKSLKILEEVQDKEGMTYLLNNIGTLYVNLNNYEKALEYYQKSLEAGKEIDDKIIYSSSLIGLATTYFKQKNYTLAQKHSIAALETAQASGLSINIRQASELLSKIYAAEGKYKEAYEMHYLFKQTADNISNEKTQKEALKKQLQYEFEKKEVLAKAEQEIKEQKAKDEKRIVYGVLVVLIIGCVAIVLFFIQRRKIDRIKAIQEKEALEKNKFELELKWFNSELKALRSQMNPHFIFNCMASIQRFMIQNDPTSAAKFLSKFARLIRSILENSEHAFISLDSELKMLEDYLDLEKLRFGKKFNYFISVDESIYPELIEIPSMLIQPYIENSIIHGIGPRKDENGRIDVNFKIEGNILHCEIIDNGVGRKKAAEIKSQMELAHKSLGISILKERLELINAKENIDVYSRMIDLEDENHHPLGTKVELNIPLRNRKLQ
ncbi:MAG: tetratricopeptide repeat protein [Bacteroidota bacterium]